MLAKHRIVTDSLNDGYEKQELTSSQKIGILSLIYKKGNPYNLEHWRSISILNIDYTIGERVLANRLQHIIHKIISHDQQGYTKTRLITFNLLTAAGYHWLIDYGNIDGAIAFIDFRKAYDTVDSSI